MAPNVKIIGGCPKCGGGDMACRYNHFERGDLTIDSWEHKCPDCGYRDTKAWRSDEEQGEALEALNICPFCERTGN